VVAFLTGTSVSESTVSRFFNHGFPIRGGLCRPNLVPIDKFKPENIERAFEYLQVLAQIAPHRLVFGDEKHLKGQDLFNRKNRKNPMTGETAKSTQQHMSRQFGVVFTKISTMQTTLLWNWSLLFNRDSLGQVLD
jgi:hypothetical protein